MSFGCVQAWMTETGREVLLLCYVQISLSETLCKSYNCNLVVDCIKREGKAINAVPDQYKTKTAITQVKLFLSTFTNLYIFQIFLTVPCVKQMCNFIDCMTTTVKVVSCKKNKKSIAKNKEGRPTSIPITDRGAAESTALTYYSDHLKQTIKQEVMFQHVITWCSSRTRDREKHRVRAMNQIGNALSQKMTY